MVPMVSGTSLQQHAKAATSGQHTNSSAINNKEILPPSPIKSFILNQIAMDKSVLSWKYPSPCSNHIFRLFA